jgi:integrase
MGDGGDRHRAFGRPLVRPLHFQDRVLGIPSKRVSPHSLRHTTAMHLLQSGLPFNIIALRLGHESTTTTHRYVEANLQMKEKALARLEQCKAR